MVLGFTDHDRTLSLDGVSCMASSGLTAGSLQQATGLSVDNIEATGALSHDAIREEDIRAGRWDSAAVAIWLVNWADTSMRELLFSGTMGEITWGGGAFSVELRGLTENLNRVRGRVYQARCDAVLGDSRCRVALDTKYAVEIAVRKVTEGRILDLPDLGQFAPKWFEHGRLLVLSGEASGLTGRIKNDRSEAGIRRVMLWSGLRADVKPGDLVRLEAGCDKRRETCRFKFHNLINFRGFADIPGDDWLMAYPKSSGRNDGGRG